MMHIHLVEPLSSGHRLQFVRRLVEAPAGGDVRWSLSTFRSTRDHPAFAAIAPRLAEIHDLPGDEPAFLAGVRGRSGLAQSWAWWDLLHGHWRGLDAARRGDLAFVPFLDYCLYAAGWKGLPFGGTPAAGIVMRPSFHYRAMGVEAPGGWGGLAQRWLLGRLLARPELTRLLTIDEPLHGWIAAHRPRLAAKTAYIQDPADLAPGATRAAGRARFGVAVGQRAVLVFGAISTRKGIDALLDALADPACPTDLAALVVGRWEDAARGQLAGPAATALRAAGRLHIHDAYVDAADEALAFAAADLAWLGYRDFHGSSGVLMQAAQAGLPVIGCRAGLVGWTIRRHGLGEALEVDDREAVRAALDRLTASGSIRPAIPAHLRHPPHFGDAVLTAIRPGGSP